MTSVQVLNTVAVLTSVVVIFAIFASFYKGKVVTLHDDLVEQYVELNRRNVLSNRRVDRVNAENEQLRQYVSVLEARVQALYSAKQTINTRVNFV